jgi:hypothetical protein
MKSVKNALKSDKIGKNGEQNWGEQEIQHAANMIFIYLIKSIKLKNLFHRYRIQKNMIFI